MRQLNNMLPKFYVRTLIFFVFLSFFSCNRDHQEVSRKITSKVISLSNSNSSKIEINNNGRAKVIFTLDPECPLCQSYTKEINSLFQKYNEHIDFINVFPSKEYNLKKIKNFNQRNHLNIPTIIDTNQIVTNYLDAQVTPECFLLDSNLNILYSGLINDWIKEIGRKGQTINNHYLDNNITLFLEKKSIIINKTKAIGCIIQKK